MTNTDGQLDQALRSLDPERTPDRDLWPGIAERLDQAPRHRRHPWRYAAAAGLVAAIAGGLMLAPRAPEAPPITVASGPEAVPRAAHDAEPWGPMLATFRQAEQAIRASAPQPEHAPQGDAAPLAGTRELETAIQKLEQQSAALREALKADPNNVDTIQTLARVERRRLELIRLVAQLDQAPAGGLSHADITF